MFRETDTDAQMSLFENPVDFMGKRAAKKFDDPKSWFNQFHSLVTAQVDENVFRPLFKEGVMGAPTASVRRLVAMMALKEGFGCSDEELMEKCDYDLLTRRALGLQMHDEAPSIDTYYCFRRRICEYADRTGENLMETCFSRLTGLQAAKFKIGGRAVRMDSKLIGSNIAWYPRYELIHKTFLQEIGQYEDRLNPALRRKVRPWLEEDAKQTVYRSDSEAIQRKLVGLGRVIYAVLVRVKAQDGLLKRVFEEQYVVEHGAVTPRDRRQIAAGSVQNPNDPDAEYRQKGQQKVKGYAVNITETAGQKGDAPDLITGVQVKGATAADNAFYGEAIAKSEAATGDKVETVYSDGAYQSAGNRALEVNGVFTGLQGRQSRYRIDEGGDGTARITDTQTGEVYEAKMTGGGALRIPYPKKESRYKWRYFLPKQLESMRSRRLMEDIPPEEKSKRNNVEASIFQLCFHTRNNKTRYRGRRKHELWALARCMWINLRRLVLFQGRMTPDGPAGGQNGPLAAILRLASSMKQTFGHLKLHFFDIAVARCWAAAS